jgi:hypothetical protein
MNVSYAKLSAFTVVSAGKKLPALSEHSAEARHSLKLKSPGGAVHQLLYQ